MKGNLKTTKLPSVFREITVSKKSGLLSLQMGDVQKAVYFEKGNVVATESNRKEESLGHLLLDMGMIDLEGLREGMKGVQPGITLKSVLVETGRFTEEQLQEVLQRLIAKNRISNTEVFQNYPNPFNPETWIPFQLSEGSEVEVSIHNSAGQLVRTLNLGFRHAGYYASRENAVYWDGRDQNGEQAASGVYFYTVRAGKYAATRKMLLVK